MEQCLSGEAEIWSLLKESVQKQASSHSAHFILILLHNKGILPGKKKSSPCTDISLNSFKSYFWSIWQIKIDLFVPEIHNSVVLV